MEINKEILSALHYFKEQFEHEFRFGTKQNNKFSPGVSKQEFDRILGFISSFAEFKGSTFSHTICFKDGFRKRTFFQKNNNPASLLVCPKETQGSSEEIILKKTMSTIDLDDYNTRFSVSHEIPASIDDCQTETHFKNMKRLVYQHGAFRVDFSLYNNSKEYDNELFFDVEVEVLARVSYSEVSYFIENILKALNNEEFLVKISEKNTVSKAWRQLVKSPFYFGCQPIPLKSKLNGDYSVSLKLDGVRALLVIFDGKVYSLDSHNKVKFTGNKSKANGSIFDCELYKGIYYVFDVIFHENKDLRQDPSFDLKKRLELVKNFAKYNNVTVKEHHFQSPGNCMSSIALRLLESKDFKNDGVIFTPVSTNYPLSSKDLSALPLKWKPVEMITIDFHIKKARIDENFEKLEFYVIDSKGAIVPFKVVEDCDNSINDTVLSIKEAARYQSESIVECSFDTLLSCFTPLRARPDKTKPNHVSVALDNFSLIIAPFELKNLEKTRNQTYFFDMRRFHNYIKRLILDTYSVKNGKGGHLDLACGKGGDIYKWGDTSIRYVEGYDICGDSIAEATRRNAKFVEKPIYKNMDYSFQTLDLSKQVLQSNVVFDSASCFFAIHYFFKDQASFYNLMKNTAQLKIGGHFMVSCFCSEKLAKVDYSISNSKFEVRPVKGGENGKFGKKINVFLKDTVLNEETMEYVVDYPYFISLVEKMGFKLVETKLFEDYYDDWKENNNKLNNLSKAFSFLNRSFVFVKTHESNYVEEAKPKTFEFSEFFDFCDTEGLEEIAPVKLDLENLKTKKLQELKNIAKDLGIEFDKKISKKVLLEVISASVKN